MSQASPARRNRSAKDRFRNCSSKYWSKLVFFMPDIVDSSLSYELVRLKFTRGDCLTYVANAVHGNDADFEVEAFSAKWETIPLLGADVQFAKG